MIDNLLTYPKHLIANNKMTEEKQIILDKINNQIARKKKELLSKLSPIYEIDESCIHEFVNNWNYNENINSVNNMKKEDEKTIIFY